MDYTTTSGIYIQELIAFLEEVISEYGNIPVYVMDNSPGIEEDKFVSTAVVVPADTAKNFTYRPIRLLINI